MSSAQGPIFIVNKQWEKVRFSLISFAYDSKNRSVCSGQYNVTLHVHGYTQHYVGHVSVLNDGVSCEYGTSSSEAAQ